MNFSLNCKLHNYFHTFSQYNNSMALLLFLNFSPYNNTMKHGIAAIFELLSDIIMPWNIIINRLLLLLTVQCWINIITRNILKFPLWHFHLPAVSFWSREFVGRLLVITCKTRRFWNTYVNIINTAYIWRSLSSEHDHKACNGSPWNFIRSTSALNGNH